MINASCHLRVAHATDPRDDAETLLFDQRVTVYGDQPYPCEVDGLMFEYDVVLDDGVRFGSHRDCEGDALSLLEQLVDLAEHVNECTSPLCGGDHCAHVLYPR